MNKILKVLIAILIIPIVLVIISILGMTVFDQEYVPTGKEYVEINSLEEIKQTDTSFIYFSDKSCAACLSVDSKVKRAINDTESSIYKLEYKEAIEKKLITELDIQELVSQKNEQIKLPAIIKYNDGKAVESIEFSEAMDSISLPKQLEKLLGQKELPQPKIPKSILIFLGVALLSLSIFIFFSCYLSLKKYGFVDNAKLLFILNIACFFSTVIIYNLLSYGALLNGWSNSSLTMAISNLTALINLLNGVYIIIIRRKLKKEKYVK